MHAWGSPWLLLALPLILAVKREDFKTCDQSAFCKRHRAISESTGYEVDWSTVEKSADSFSARLANSENRLQLTVTGLTGGRLRVQIDEPRETAIRQRYVPTQALSGEPVKQAFASVEVQADHVEIVAGDKLSKAIIHRSPFVVDLFNKNDELVTQINAGGKLKVEHFRSKEDDVEYPEGFWEERFKSWTDSKPYGSSSVGVDITMVGFRTAYGLPEHADSFALKTTVGNTDPYRLFNLDVFEYEIGNPMALYVAVPYLLAHRKEATAGILWLNAAETWIDTQSTENSKGLFRKMWNKVVPDESVPNFTAHFMSESGLVDIFFFPGTTPQDVHAQLSATTGVTPLPPLFAIAYHQCRWNYKDEADVAAVNAGFDEHDIPMDVIWLDIEHTDGKKYFTWHPQHFPTPKAMIDGVSAKGRKMVTIIDPHIKKDNGYYVYKDAKDQELFVKRADNTTDFEGHCWPGSSEYLDFFNPNTRNYWIAQFKFDRYEGSTPDLFTWNDMNEPSVFSGPEVTMDRDSLHYGGMEHREVHNIYGMQYHQTTFEGLLERTGGKDRPFLLTRSGFVGTQRSAAVWTGDNAAEWSHLAIAAPMTLSLSVAGIPFVGADVGGFFGNPNEELLVRWYQVGAYQPFFRAHAHIDTRRREPWLFSEATKLSIRRSIRERYALLPYWYALFREHALTGVPPMRPIFYEFPNEERFFETDSAWMVGNGLFVNPVVEEGKQSVDVTLPGKDGNMPGYWYDFHTGVKVAGGLTQTVSNPLYESKTPAYQRGGTIIPTWQRIRRASPLMRDDPYTLFVALDLLGQAKGTLYIDDGKTHAYRDSGEYLSAQLEYATTPEAATFTFKPKGTFQAKNWIERIEVRGALKAPTAITLVKEAAKDEEPEEIGFDYFADTKTLVIRNPRASLLTPFHLNISF